MAISVLELRHIIESGLLPLRCTCSVSGNGKLSIEVVDPDTGSNVAMDGIPTVRLGTSRAISDLIAELRAQVLAPSTHRKQRQAPR